MIAVAAVYVYFLLFAQFGFLKAVQAALGGGTEVIRPIMAVMGLAGVGGSVLAARLFAEQNGRRGLNVGFGLCAAAAAGSMGANSLGEFSGVAFLVGLGTGLTTVTLAGMLRRAAGDMRLGLIIGTGTGLAYGICNLPGIFDACPEAQAQWAVVAVAAGWAGGRRLTPQFRLAQTGGEYSKPATAAWVVVFAALVCLDSAAFYIIQHTSALKERMWAGTEQLLLNASAHLVVAVLAGWALDRGWLGRAVGLGAAALLLACGLLDQPAPAGVGLLYIAGVSLYSTGLVYYPSRSGRPGLAALVYVVAGWGGSALGIGLVEGQQELFPVFIGTAGTIILVGFILRGLDHGQKA